MSSPIDCWRSLIAEVRRRLREIRACRPCYKVGIDSLGPLGPDDVITADDRWHSPASGDPLTDLRAAKEAYMRAFVDPPDHEDDEPLDLREIN